MENRDMLHGSDVRTLLGELLVRYGLRISTADSCTGGALADALTALPGASEWFDCGWVVYSNNSKTQALGVSEQLISAYGAVSGQVVEAMATQALKKSQSNLSVAISGVAGPTGGTEDKPVGLVWFAWALEEEVITASQQFSGDRESIREQAVEAALQGLLGLVFELGSE